VTRVRPACLLVVVATLTAIFAASLASAHESRPALLDITESKGGWVEVVWKLPMRGDRPLGIEPLLPPGLARVGGDSERVVPGAWIRTSNYRNEGGGLVGESITIEGLEALQTDVLVRVALADGSHHSAILRPAAPTFEIPARETKSAIAVSYWRMGAVHILEGVDHLLFLLAILLIVSGFGQLLKTITAFTLAHSITLAAATLGMVNVPPAPTEAVIALSILFLAVEIVRKHDGVVGLTERKPWLVALAFGLFHGLGFAGALSEVGVPAHEVPLALLVFNVGVETGQIMFVVAVVGVLAALRRLPISLPEGAWRLAPYGIGSLAAFWTIDRVIIAINRGVS